jgi:tetrahydromethanopterin S-methyltransferase subunit G
MTNELQELRQHVRWLEDERRDVGAVEKHLDEIDGDLDGIIDRLNEIDGRLDEVNGNLTKLANAYTGIADAINGYNAGLKEAFSALLHPPPPPPMGDIINEFFKPTNGRKERAAKPKPRKPKLSVVSKDSDDGPGAAS